MTTDYRRHLPSHATTSRIPHSTLTEKFSAFTFYLLTLFSCLAVLTITVLAPQPAIAADDAEEVTSISTATVTASYSHPETGEIIDSGGESSAVLGQSMVEGTTHETALVEVDENGLTWVTLRFNLASYLSVLSILYAAPASGNDFTQTAEVTFMQGNEEEDTADYRFQVPSIDYILQINLDVEPMGRTVAYYATLSDLVDSNTDGFVESVEAGLPLAIATAEEEVTEEAESTEAGTETEDTSAETSGSDNESSESSEEGENSGISVPLIVGIIVVVVLVLAVIGYVLWRKQKNSPAKTVEDSAEKLLEASKSKKNEDTASGDKGKEGKDSSNEEQESSEDGKDKDGKDTESAAS